MLPSFMKQIVTRIRPGSRELRGSTVPDWESASEIEISGCSMQPASTSLSQDGRVVGIRDAWTLYAPADADIKEGDRIGHNEKVFTVAGVPREWPSASGALNHMEIPLERWSG